MGKPYKVLRRLGSRVTGKHWSPGEIIHLGDAQAAIHLARGNVEALPAPAADLLPVQRIRRQRKPAPAEQADTTENTNNGTTDGS